MEDIEKIEDFAELPLKYAWGFLSQKGLEKEANEIRQSKYS